MALIEQANNEHLVKKCTPVRNLTGSQNKEILYTNSSEKSAYWGQLIQSFKEQYTAWNPELFLKYANLSFTGIYLVLIFELTLVKLI